MGKDRSKDWRDKENRDLVRRLKAGEPLNRYKPEDTWFPPRPNIKKDKKVLDFPRQTPDNVIGLKGGQKVDLCPSDCPFLTLKEEKQNQKKFDPHWCKKYNKQVRHFGHHPHVVKLEECIKEKSDESNTDI